MINKIISHYKILEKIGSGGMGIVYKAEDVKLKRFVALKFLPEELIVNQEAKKRFIQEARAASALDHPNICNIHEINETEAGQIFIVMACYEGEMLKERIRRGPLNLQEVIDIGIQICRGLGKAHQKGFVHRDIKPANIFITNEGIAKILDFGLVKLADQIGISKTGTTVGTVAYMSPEQIQAFDVDHRSDLWSLGVILYEMLTSQLPFKGNYEAAVIYEILNKESEALQLFRTDIPDNVITLIGQLLQKNPVNRIASANEVIIKLEEPPKEIKQRDDQKSIAVLYFENMSTEKENEYFCAGMTEDLIIDLSKIHKLRVIPRSDVLPFRNKEVNSRQVGETLDVQYILEGSVRRGGNRIRITAQLIDVKTGFQVWAERYDRFLEDIFDIQMEVSEKIAEALKVSLTESEKQLLAQKPTDDLRAYDFYMRGSEMLLQKGKKNIDTAIQMFEHALSLDPNFSLACVGLAEAYFYNFLFYGGDRVWLKKMMEMNEKALKLNPDSVEVQYSIGVVYYIEKRLMDARAYFEKVISMKNDFYPAYYWLGITSNILEDYQAAIHYLQVGAAIKPYSEECVMLILETYFRKGDLDAAKEVGMKLIDIVKRKLEVNPNDLTALSRIAMTYAFIGDKTKALNTAQKVLDLKPNDGRVLYNCADTYAYLGKKKEALSFLEKSLKMGFINLVNWIKGDPFLDSIRTDPKFDNIISKYSI
jgi:non-specific serine/threonine protein kinase